MPPRDFEAEIAREEARLQSERNTAVYRLRELEEARARQALGVDELLAGVCERVCAGLDPGLAERACAWLVNAERWQWEIGSWSTGAGEGLASMTEVYTLKLAQAWLHACGGRGARALELVHEIERDPNRLGLQFRDPIARLAEFMRAG